MALKVIVQPLIVWLWIGGSVMAVGSVMAAFPGKRRKPTDAVSAPVGRTDHDGPSDPPREQFAGNLDEASSRARAHAFGTAVAKPN